MLASGLGFTVYLVLAKLLSDNVHPLFLAFIRAFAALVLTLPLIARAGLGMFRTPQPGLILLRSLLGSLGFGLSLIAVSDALALPLSAFNAISFSRPLFVTLLAALLLREAVGPRRWSAVAAGFLGVVVMTAPGFAGGDGAASSFGLGGLLALLSSVAFAGAIILVKTLSTRHSPTVLLIWANLLSSLFLLPFGLYFWTSPSLGDWGWILLMSVAGLGAQYCYITAMSIGDASFLSPMDYLRLPLAAGADWALFRLLPGVNVWIGAAVIVASTLYLALRGRAASKPVEKDAADPL